VFDHRGIFVNLNGRSGRGLGFSLEEVADTGGQTTAKFEGFCDLNLPRFCNHVLGVCDLSLGICGLSLGICGLSLGVCGLSLGDYGLNLGDCGLSLRDCGLSLGDCDLIDLGVSRDCGLYLILLGPLEFNRPKKIYL